MPEKRPWHKERSGIFFATSLITKTICLSIRAAPYRPGRCRHRRLPIRLRTAKSRNQGAAPGPPGYGPGSTHPPEDRLKRATGGASQRDRNFARIICRFHTLIGLFIVFTTKGFCALVFWAPSTPAVRNANFAACATKAPPWRGLGWVEPVTGTAGGDNTDRERETVHGINDRS